MEMATEARYQFNNDLNKAILTKALARSSPVLSSLHDSIFF